MKVQIKKNKIPEIVQNIKKTVVAKVGIIGANAQKIEDDITLPYLGLIHEKGSILKNIPARSFLYVPLSNFLKERIEKEEKNIKEKIQEANIFETKKIMAKIGVIAVNLVLDAFETQGFGKWKPRKDNLLHPLLIKTGTLRNSITYEIMERK